jgi:hypothetical protein
VIRQWPQPVSEVFRNAGLDGLEQLPSVGPTIARALRELITRGYLPMLDRLRGTADPFRLLASVPTIGCRLAERLHDELAISTLEDLEAAAHDGRLATILGFGPKRLAGVRDSLAQRLGRVRPPSSVPARRLQASCRRSRRDASTHPAARGFRCSTRIAARAGTRRCSQIPRERTS